MRAFSESRNMLSILMHAFGSNFYEDVLKGIGRGCECSGWLSFDRVSFCLMANLIDLICLSINKLMGLQPRIYNRFINGY